MNEYDCWCVVTRFAERKQYDRAIEFCETEPYSRLPYCQNYLGWTFYGLKKYETSAHWFSKAVEQGNAEALFGMGSIFMAQGDLQSAIPCLEDSAKKGFSRAYFWIALVYYYGNNDVPRDMGRATHYFQIAADHGSIMAKRFIIFLESRGWTWRRFVWWFKLAPLLIRVMIISSRNPYDFRIIDIGYQHKSPFPNPYYKLPEL
ncbi:SEL1-like repeat protein [Burkholderia sp. Ac-20353]|uniref:tetratricopeptide repeat protein n=1 Tax=Burkholderia sp. Ac-20353 TaxID=2703894 RepID=UPI00197C5355|nr:SEL1-like repeat protein [Burkholderia sp. Ac-20353]MBN3787250.1 sel1 repeat family protein [Burkholderia sp. Ac-20353]